MRYLIAVNYSTRTPGRMMDGGGTTESGVWSGGDWKIQITLLNITIPQKRKV